MNLMKLCLTYNIYFGAKYVLGMITLLMPHLIFCCKDFISWVQTEKVIRLLFLDDSGVFSVEDIGQIRAPSNSKHSWYSSSSHQAQGWIGTKTPFVDMTRKWVGNTP